MNHRDTETQSEEERMTGPEVLAVVSTATNVLLVLVTICYVVINKKVLDQSRAVTGLMREQHHDATRPYVTVDVTTARYSIFTLRIRNTGKTAARNLQLSIDREFWRFGLKDEHHNVRTSSAFANPIKLFAPDSELLFDLGVSSQIYNQPHLTPHEFEITATYSYSDRTVSESTHIDLWIFRGTTVNPSALVEELHKIGEAIEKLQVK